MKSFCLGLNEIDLKVVHDFQSCQILILRCWCVSIGPEMNWYFLHQCSAVENMTDMTTVLHVRHLLVRYTTAYNREKFPCIGCKTDISVIRASCSQLFH
jgi:hypothetical protein